MINQEVKGTLAKLLATENLTVEHRQVTTAYFDVENRVLCLPIWKHASETVYDLLVGHEVGHALYTPAEGLECDVPKSFINVLEDARIEKMMKRTYPGLRKSFFDGYKELWDMDFFGVKHEDHETLSLIDRINLYFKGNTSIPFSADEKHWIEKTGRTETFQDVLDLARELYEWAESKQAEKEEEMDIPVPQNADGGEGESNGNDDGKSEGGEKEETDQDPDQEIINPTQPWDSSDNPLEDLSEGLGQQQQKQDTSGIGGDSYDASNLDTELVDELFDDVDETESVTDQALQDALEDLIDDDAKEWIYLNLPKIDVDLLTVPYTEIQSDLEKFYTDWYYQEYQDDDRMNYRRENLDYCDRHYESFKKSAQKSVNYLVKQFEMKKSADEYKRAAVSKTGVINTNTLYKYKLTDDIFKKVTTVPEGKNHGLVLHLDWSGSMQYGLLDTLKQTMNLIWFCRKAQIPFRVYAFQSSFHHYGRDEYGNPIHNKAITAKENDLGISDDFRLLELFSSKQNAKSLEKSCKMIYRQVFAMNGRRINYLDKYALGGTPLSEAILCTRHLVNKLKKEENVQKVNVVCLTDGESNPMTYWQKTTYSEELRMSQICSTRTKVFVLRDHETRYQRKIGSSPYETTKEIVSYFREITDYNWIGIRLCSKSELSRLMRCLCLSTDEQDAIDTQWKKERFASIKNQVGFSESFYMPDRGIGEDTQKIEVKQKGEVATRAELQRAFKKHMGSKTTNKTLLNAFVEQIA